MNHLCVELRSTSLSLKRDEAVVRRATGIFNKSQVFHFQIAHTMILSIVVLKNHMVNWQRIVMKFLSDFLFT